jgi:hypothetical protein
MELELWQLKNIIQAAAEEAVRKYIAMTNPTDDEISARQAYKEFGEGWVKSQVACGVIKPLRKGTSKNSKKVYSRYILYDLKNGANPLLKAVATF